MDDVSESNGLQGSQEPPAPLAGVKVVSLAVNLPGPVAAHRFTQLGAEVIKVEPPSGDPLALAAPEYYRSLFAGQEVITADLKSDEGAGRLAGLLDGADLLVTSNRLRALAKLGLDWDSLHRRYPRLSQVAIVGHPGADADIPGHDLTYQADAGTVASSGTPPTPQIPMVPVADLGGAERAVTEGVAALFIAAKSGEGRFVEVGLAEVVEDFAATLRFGLSGPGTVLGGGYPTYGIYAAQDGHVALAAIEPHFAATLATLMGLDSPFDVTEEALTSFFATDTVEHWCTWAREHGLPLTGVR